MPAWTHGDEPEAVSFVRRHRSLVAFAYMFLAVEALAVGAKLGYLSEGIHLFSLAAVLITSILMRMYLHPRYGRR